MRTQVLILGGGCGGLWLLYKFSQLRYSSLLVDYPADSVSFNLGRFASTRGQNRLHTGALYGIVNEQCTEKIAAACGAGFNELHRFCHDNDLLDAVEPVESSGCLYLFTTEDEANQAHNRLNDFDLISRLVYPREFLDMEPVLVDSDESLKLGLLTPETPFDSYSILTTLVRAINDLDGKFQPAPNALTELRITRDRDIWRVEGDGGFLVEAPIVVCAAGVLNPVMLERVAGHQGEMKIDKTLITVLHQRVCQKIICVQSIPVLHFIALIPFDGGTTVTTGISSRTITEVTDNSPWFDELYITEELLPRYLPAILNSFPCQAHFYTCQKLENTNYETNLYKRNEFGARHYFWIEDDQRAPNFFCFSPGKFTLAPVAAQKFIDFLKQERGDFLRGPIDQTFLYDNGLSVARRPYYEAATHVARASGEEFIFEAADGWANES